MFLSVYLNTIIMLVHFPEETTDFFSPKNLNPAFKSTDSVAIGLVHPLQFQ
jgi:hypothetical protein